MSMRIYFREQPRTLLLATEAHALSFQCVTDNAIAAAVGSNVNGNGGSGGNGGGNGGGIDSASDKREYGGDRGDYSGRKESIRRNNNGPQFLQSSTRVLVDFMPRSEIDFDVFRPLSSISCFGCLGLIAVEGDLFLAIITGATQVAEPVTHRETVYRIHGLEFYCVSRSTWDFIVLDPSGNPLDSAGLGIGSDNYDFANSGGTQSGSNAIIEHPCVSLRKLLTDGSFYYSNDFDLTSRMQSRSSEPTFDIDGFDEAFMWNGFMISELVKYRSHLQPEEKLELDHSRFLTSVIRGFAETVKTKIESKPATLTIISRQGCRRAGTRYNARGIDDEGNVANFVETETIINTKDCCFSYTQIRGSVPIFWEQDVQLLSAKVTITRAFEATQPAFMAHFDPIINKYGPVHIVNLLSSKPGEYELTQRYHQHIKHAAERELADQLRETKFDFHVETAKAGYAAANRIIRFIQDDADEFGFFLYDSQNREAVFEQTGVFRTNCLDCLDRTNLVQQIISKLAIEIFAQQKDILPGNELWLRHSVLWADNGDQLSKIYAGTGALKTSFTRSGKMSLAGAIADATKSVSRMYINNFVDKGRQNTIDVLLGRLEGQQKVLLHDPINDYVTAELAKRKEEFTSSREISVFVGTFNLNGFLFDGDLSQWLFPDASSDIETADLVIVGFQEIVELTAGQILSADPAKRQFWEHQVSRCLNAHGEYVLLRSGQLVGTALLMYVKASEVRQVRNINGAMKKTGLGGMAGNKGGVAFSCDYASTKLCFITSHLAAGLSNVEDRNHDYRTIANGIRFPRGKTLKDHDTVIWLGDFNYRIDLPNDEVRKLIEYSAVDELYKYDQLNRQMLNGQVFPFFSEARITFKPTYKFDNGTDTYDTSDKARIPAWTDRILMRGNNIRQVNYGSGPLKFSDHRPVYAGFKVTVYTVNDQIKERLSQELYAKRRGYVGQLLEFDGELPGNLPAPSTDKHKWWLEGGRSAKVTVSAPRPNMVVNPNRPSNPFTPTTQPDFIGKNEYQANGLVGSDRAGTSVAAAAAASSLGNALRTSTTTPPTIPKKPNNLSGTRLHALNDETIPPALPPRRLTTASSTASLLSSSPSSSSSSLSFSSRRPNVDTQLQTFGRSSSGEIIPLNQSNSTTSMTTTSAGIRNQQSFARLDFPSTSLSKVSRTQNAAATNRDISSTTTPPPFPPRPQSSSVPSVTNRVANSKPLPSTSTHELDEKYPTLTPSTKWNK
ncbi:SacI homology domain-containing protein [Lipomyces japonicus]|uniref:SacI homology domain-containing protein n=1 Tax=Lipomyces japonicus TaxID=56871 RepID=UPI0034CECB16